jgi:hypothetical protein
VDVAEQFAADYLNKHSLRPERFGKQEMRLGKTPDFRVFKHAELVAYCEAKHVQYDTWLDEQLKEAQPLQFVGGLRPDPIFNRLTTHIHRAAQQFVAGNPNHDYPNVLVLANSDSHSNFKDDLVAVLTGNFYGDGGVVEPIFEQFSNGRIMYEKMLPDLYVWWDCWKDAARPYLYFWENSKHFANVCALFGSDPAKHRRVRAVGA